MMDGSDAAGLVYREPPEGEWPETDLEHLGKCPVCGCAERSLAYSGLRDKVFFCAPGTWTSWRCASCEVAYLDPRPTPSSIGRAYETYYTHGTGEDTARSKRGLLAKLRRIVPNSYLNKNFGYRLRPSLPLASLLLESQPGRALSTSHFFRHLPAPRNEGDCLLDIGCGDGGFLRTARDYLNYRVEGLEIDPRARAVAQSRGLTIHAGLMPGSGLKEGSYYQITLSHVLEHLHDPVAALREIFTLLKPGGRVWITVPNIDAVSLTRFGSNSALLDAPRHLVMFGPKSLKSMLGLAGFRNIEFFPTDADEWVHEISMIMEKGADPFASKVSTTPYQDVIKRPRNKYTRIDEKAECVTVVAFRKA